MFLSNLQYKNNLETKILVKNEDKTLNQAINEETKYCLEHISMTPSTPCLTIDSINSHVPTITNSINSLQNRKRQEWLKNEQIDIMSQSNPSEIRSSISSIDYFDFNNDFDSNKSESSINDLTYKDKCIPEKTICNKLDQERFCNLIGQTNSLTCTNNHVNGFEIQRNDTKLNLNSLNFEETNDQQIFYLENIQTHTNKNSSQSNIKNDHNRILSISDDIYNEKDCNPRKLKQLKTIENDANVNPSNHLNMTQFHDRIIMQQNPCNKKSNESSKHFNISSQSHNTQFVGNFQKNGACYQHQDDNSSQKLSYFNTLINYPYSSTNFVHEEDLQTSKKSPQSESKIQSKTIPNFHINQSLEDINNLNDFTNINSLKNSNIDENEFDVSLANSEHKVTFSMQSVHCVRTPLQKNQIDFDQRCDGSHGFDESIHEPNESCNEHWSDDQNNIQIDEVQRDYYPSQMINENHIGYVNSQGGQCNPHPILHYPTEMINDGQLGFVDLEEGLQCNPSIQQYIDNFKENPSNYYLPIANNENNINDINNSGQYVENYSNNPSTSNGDYQNAYDNSYENYDEKAFNEFETNEDDFSENSRMSTLDQSSDYSKRSIIDQSSGNSRRPNVDYNSSINNRRSTIEHPSGKRMSIIDHSRRPTIDHYNELMKKIELIRSIVLQNDLKNEANLDIKGSIVFQNEPKEVGQKDIKILVNFQKALEKEAEIETEKSISLQKELQRDAQFEIKKQLLDELEDELEEKLEDVLHPNIEGTETSILKLLSESEAEMESLAIRVKAERNRGDISPKPHAQMEGYKKKLEEYKRIQEEKRQILWGALSRVVNGNFRQATTYATCRFCNLNYSEELEKEDTDISKIAPVTDEELYKLIEKNELESAKLANRIQYTLNADPILPDNN